MILLIDRISFHTSLITSPHLIELLNLMKETENDELTAVIQKLVIKYQDDILPIAVDMVNHLATIFKQVYQVACVFVHNYRYSETLTI